MLRPGDLTTDPSQEAVPLTDPTHHPGGVGIGALPVRGRRGGARGWINRAESRKNETGHIDELGLKRLDLTADPGNFASQRVAEKVGFQREGLIRSILQHPEGHRRDAVLFSLLPGELR